MICIYHSRDQDGYCSGAIVKKKYPEAELIGYDYGEPFPWDKVKDQDVIMVDVSLPMEEMADIALQAKSFTWIDHHASAINDYHSADSLALDKIEGDLKIGKAACELAWDYFFPDEPMPYFVFLLGTYDVFRKNDMKLWEEEVMPFQFGMRMKCNSATTFPMELFYDESLRVHIMFTGRDILEYQKQQNEGLMKGSFRVKVGGYNAICCNVGLVNFNSQSFASVFDPLEDDIMLAFCFLGPKLNQWRVSFYADNRDDVDVSIIAKRFGGGGHKGAAGCQVEDWKQVIEA